MRGSLQTFSRKDMSTDQLVGLLQRHSAGPNLIGQSREADLENLFGITIGLPVQGLTRASASSLVSSPRSNCVSRS